MQHTPQSGQSGQNQQNRPQGQHFQKPFGQQNQQQKGAPFQNQQNRPGQQPISKPSPWAAPAQPPKVMTPIVSAPQASCSSGRMFLLGIIIGMAIVWVWGDMHRNKAASGVAIEQGSDAFATTGIKSSTVKNTKAATVAVADTDAAGTKDATEGVSGVPSQNAIQLADSQLAGAVVAVDGIAAAEPMWAVVYEYTDGAMGRVLGAARFTPDQTSGSVELMRSTLPKLHYFVGLVADTADHTYNIHVNAPLVDKDGKQIGAAFTAE